jgi:hypothetical protein
VQQVKQTNQEIQSSLQARLCVHKRGMEFRIIVYEDVAWSGKKERATGDR